MKKATLHNEQRDNVYATIRLTKAQVAHLRNFMHSTPGQDVTFPYGVRLVHQSSGWYRILPAKEYRATENILFAIKLIGRAHAEYDEQVLAETQHLLAIAFQKGQVQNIGYSTDRTSGHGFTTVRQATPQQVDQHRARADHKQVRVASADRLQALANRFNNRKVA